MHLIVFPSVNLMKSCLHYCQLSVARASAPPQEATKPAMKTEQNTSGIPQPTSVASQGSVATATSQLPTKPANTSQAPNGTSSLPVSKLSAVGTLPVLVIFAAN
jgi:hypothetical protein